MSDKEEKTVEMQDVVKSPKREKKEKKERRRKELDESLSTSNNNNPIERTTSQFFSSGAQAVGALLFSASKGDVEEVRKLVASGSVKVNEGDYDKRTALHVAAAEGHLDVVKYVLSMGANINCVDRWGGTPLDDAIRHGKDAVSKFLIANGANNGANTNFGQDLISAASKGELDTVIRLLDNGIPVNSCDYDKRTPLHVAVAERQTEIVKLLLERGADVNALDRFGGSPLHEAQRVGVRLGTDNLVELLEAAANKDKGVMAAHHKLHLFSNVFFLMFLIAEIIWGILFALFVVYKEGNVDGTSDITTAIGDGIAQYPFYMDVHVMIFIGFGFLMTFLRKYGFTSVGLTFLIGAFTIQWYILVGGFFEQAIVHGHFTKIGVDIKFLIRADFAAGAVLISFGALLGKTSAAQMLTMVIAEVALYSINEAIGLKMQIADLGGSMVIHTFGAYFGLAASAVVTPNAARGNKDNSSVYRSDLFSMIGTVFLWMYWPSFNAALGNGNTQQRAVVNTVLSISASCVFAFLMSQAVRNEKVFCMVDIQNATLAGGVAAGASADMILHPGFSLLVGALAGTISVIGFSKLQPYIERKLRIHDTCGINNLHGMPGIIGAVVSMIASSVADDKTLLSTQQRNAIFMAVSRSASDQAKIQLAYLIITLSIAIVGGILTGYLIKAIDPPQEYFVDSSVFEVPRLELPYYFDERGEIVRTSQFVHTEFGGTSAGADNKAVAALEAKIKNLESKLSRQQPMPMMPFPYGGMPMQMPMMPQQPQQQQPGEQSQAPFGRYPVVYYM